MDSITAAPCSGARYTECDTIAVDARAALEIAYEDSGVPLLSETDGSHEISV